MRRLEYPEIEFTAPFSIEECRIRLMNRPARLSEDVLTGFDPWVNREDAATYSFEILRMRRYQNHGRFNCFIEMHGLLRAMNAHETNVRAEISIRRSYAFIMVCGIVFALIWASLSWRVPLFALFGVMFTCFMIFTPLRDRSALSNLLRDTLGPNVLQPEKPAAPVAEVTHRTGISVRVGPRIRWIALLPLERCRWQMLNRDYNELEFHGAQIERPQFEHVSEDSVQFSIRRMHYRRSLTLEKANYAFSFVWLQGDLHALNAHETAVNAEIRIGLRYALSWLFAVVFSLVPILIFYWVVTNQVPYGLLLFALAGLAISLYNVTLPLFDYQVLTSHLKVSLDPKRFGSE